MAVFKIFPDKDSTLYSLFPDMNTGLDEVVSLWMDSQGNLFYLEKQLSVIRVIIASSGIVFNVAGSEGVSGFSGDGGPATSATT